MGVVVVVVVVAVIIIIIIENIVQQKNISNKMYPKNSKFLTKNKLTYFVLKSQERIHPLKICLIDCIS